MVDTLASTYRSPLEVFQSRADELTRTSSDLKWLFSKTDVSKRQLDPNRILEAFGMQSPTLNFRRHINPARQRSINPDLIRNGEITLWRGDYPGLREKGIFPFSFSRYHLTLDQMIALFEQHNVPVGGGGLLIRITNQLEGFMRDHARAGGGPFLSATTDGSVARRHPTFGTAKKSVYVLKVPIDRVVRNYARVGAADVDEDEYLISDYVLPEQIIDEVDLSPKSSY